MVGGEESSSWRREAVVGGESNELVGGERSAVVGWREESSGWMEIGEQCLDGERRAVAGWREESSGWRREESSNGCWRRSDCDWHF